MITSLSAGKLYIAGEYAVVEKGYPSIIVAIDQFIKISLKPQTNSGSIKNYGNKPVFFTRENNEIKLNNESLDLKYIVTSIKLVEKLARNMHRNLEYYQLIVESDLESIDGKKYGLGSSAAVTVGTIKVLLDFYKIELSDLEIFKVAALVNLELASKGSSGDLAASIYSGWIYFKTFDKTWLKKMAKDNSILALIKMDWPYLVIEKLKEPKDLKLVVGWTKKPASTDFLVANLHTKKTTYSSYYNNFLLKSEICVNKLRQAFISNDILEIQKQIEINRRLLSELGKKFNVEIETNDLKKLSDIAGEFGGSGKSSGAGGGDCGIVIFKDNFNLDKLVEKWHQADIEYLPLNVYKKGD